MVTKLDVDILIGQGICSNCSPIETTPQKKWGVFFRVMVKEGEGFDAFICIDCHQGFVDKAKEVKKTVAMIDKKVADEEKGAP